MSIPTIDFAPFLNEEGAVIGTEPTSEQVAVAKQMDEVCRNHGFLHIINFGLSDGLRSQAFQSSKELFDLSEDFKKNHLRRINPKDNMGFAPVLSESINRSRPNELKEAFNLRFPPKRQNDLSGCPDSFVEVTEKLQAKYRDLARRYAIACALALSLPLDFFANALVDLDLCTIRFLHYPACELDDTSAESTDRPIRIGEHTDFGAFTFLLLGENGVEGLQIKPVEGGEAGGQAGGENEGWIDVVLPNDGPQGAIVNTGALMARWTNDVWRATAHRVIVANAEMAARERFSIAFFVDPDSNSIVKVHDTFTKHGSLPKYEPITSSDYLSMKLQEMMKT